MPLTDQEIEELKNRILKLEEEKDGLKKLLDTRADKTEITAQIGDISGQLKALRDELAALKPAPPLKPTDQHVPGDVVESGFWQ